MNHTANIIETLKQYLKAKGITYKQLAEEIELSEASVKRLFSKQTFSLSRLEDVCRILDIDFYDLVLMDKERSRKTLKKLTIEQEQILVNDEKLLIFLYFFIHGIISLNFLPTTSILWSSSLVRNLLKLGLPFLFSSIHSFAKLPD